MKKNIFFYWIYKIIVSTISRFRYNLISKKVTLPEGANLIVANHVTNSDYMFIGATLSCKHMHYVMAETAVKRKLFRWFLEFAVAVIVHVKGSNALNTIKKMNKLLKEGHNVMIFPEGSTTFDGTTKAQDNSIGKLAKISGANLVMVRIKGGYFTMPRWGAAYRKGRIALDTSILSADQLKTMSAAEITDSINTNIYTDAYEEQKIDKIVFKSQKPCLGIERAMYMCPKCQTFGSLTSSAKSVTCNCGYSESLDEYGYLSDGIGQSHTITEHLHNQLNKLKYIIENSNHREDVIFSDVVNISEIRNDFSRNTLGKFTIKAYPDNLIVNSENGFSHNISIKDITNVAIFRANTLSAFVPFNAVPGSSQSEEKKDILYEITGDFTFNALKYKDLFDINTAANI